MFIQNTGSWRSSRYAQ